MSMIFETKVWVYVGNEHEQPSTLNLFANFELLHVFSDIIVEMSNNERLFLSKIIIPNNNIFSQKHCIKYFGRY